MAVDTLRAGLSEEAVEAFAAGLRGRLVRPADAEYDAARAIWNGMIDRYPALIARCRGAADVVAAVTFACEHDLLVSIRGGGHNVAGNAVNDGGIVIDLSEMRGVYVDPAARTARVQGGATWADVDRETQLFGLAAPGGVVSTTGVGRPDVARWPGLPAAQVRTHHRQPALGRDRHRRRAGAHRQPRPSMPTSSGRCAGRAATSAS